jgi:hypothetical protein
MSHAHALRRFKSGRRPLRSTYEADQMDPSAPNNPEIPDSSNREMMDKLRAEIEALKSDHIAAHRTSVMTIRFLEERMAVIDKLRAALAECAADLRAELDNRYHAYGPLSPSVKRTYDRDMKPVLAAEELLGRIPADHSTVK